MRPTKHESLRRYLSGFCCQRIPDAFIDSSEFWSARNLFVFVWEKKERNEKSRRLKKTISTSAEWAAVTPPYSDVQQQRSQHELAIVAPLSR